MSRVLFLSAGNACRGPMAEGFARARRDTGVEIVGAGQQARPLHPLAVRVMAEVGIDISSAEPRALVSLPDQSCDAVVVLSAESEDAFGPLPGHPMTVCWGLNDPDAVKGEESNVLAVFRRTRDEIRRLVDDFFAKGYFALMREAKRCESMILDNISDGVLAHDLDRRIFVFNDAAERITGYSRSEAIGRDCHDVFPGNLCGGKCLICDELSEDFESRQQELEIVTQSGERRAVQMRSRLLTDGKGRKQGILVSFRDASREQALARRVGEVEQFSGIVGRDPKMGEVFDMIRELAEVKVPVLVEGESGTGKELVAAAIHNEGPRAARLFVPVNCGALPESLLESELFGHVKGSFTGAIRDKKGRFELADGGTIFLDEIGDISPAMQIKLLRVLQEGTFERVGGEHHINVDVRVISATNKNLAEEIAAGRFREDLFYRLGVVPLTLPPLRERRNDIPLLVEHLLRRVTQDSGREGVDVAPEALDVMMSYDWPGNVRELENWLRFAMVKCRDGVILPRHLPPASGVATAASREPAGVAVPHAQRRKLDVPAVLAALRETGGNKVAAARRLGVSRATLYRFLSDSGLNLGSALKNTD